MSQKSITTSVSKGKEKKEMEVDVQDKIFVALGNKVKNNKLILVWTLQSSRGKRVCLFLVHPPAQIIPTPLGYFLVDKVEAEEVKAFREKERREMYKVLDEYAQFCLKVGVHVEKLYIEAKSIEDGIIQLVKESKIGNLVMGAASDKYYSRRMTELKSNKAIYVRENAPPYCHIWFVCKGYLIYTRAASVKPPSPDTGENEAVNDEGNEGENQSPTIFNKVDEWSPFYSSDSGYPPSLSMSRTVSERDSIASLSERRYQSSSQYHSLAHNSESVSDFDQLSVPNKQTTASTHDFQGTVPESLYIEECRKRKEVEAELAKVKEELSHMKNHILGELLSAMEQKSLLDSQIGNSMFMLKMLGKKLAYTIKSVHSYDEQ